MHMEKALARTLVRTEEQLLKLARAGNAEAFSELVHLHSSKVYGISLKILKNREDAEDNLQNVFCKAYRGIRNFQGQSKISTWLFRIAVNEALMKLRKRQSERVIGLSEVAGADDEEGGVLQMQDVRPDPERRCIATDLAAKAFRRLDASLGNTFILNKAEGWTNRELARAFGTTAETVKSRIFRTRLKLRQEMLALSHPAPVALQA
jgi:RNA polymerase sigma-70 factor, ECF subfamily